MLPVIFEQESMECISRETVSHNSIKNTKETLSSQYMKKNKPCEQARLMMFIIIFRVVKDPPFSAFLRIPRER